MLLSAAPATYADARREPYRHAALAELLIRDRTKGCPVHQCRADRLQMQWHARMVLA